MSDKKQWKMVIVAAVVFFMTISNKAEASEERARTIPILETVWVEEDMHQGNRMGLPQTSVGGGKTVSFLDSSGSMFYVSGDTTVSFSVNLNASASVQMGYINSSGSRTSTYSGNGSSHNTSFTIPVTGYYRFYVTNQSSNTIQITGGTISF